jgi:predicted signal transduction protein with EAL and GGDEF domain
VRLEAKRRQALEVTESARLEGQADGLGEPRRGLDLGVSIALDAFGTDFSSLAHLRAFPFDKIEIDGAFVRDATSRPDGAAILGVVADLGRRLGGIIVAEGVETEADPALVTAKDCIEVQGDLLGRPVPHPRDVEETDDRVAGATRVERGKPRDGGPVRRQGSGIRRMDRSAGAACAADPRDASAARRGELRRSGNLPCGNGAFRVRIRMC